MTLDLTKYIELKTQGSSVFDVSAVAREDGLNSVETIFVIWKVFEIPFAQAKEIFMTTKGNEHHLAFHEQLMDDLDKINEETELENQGGIS
jgi:hypothetical protein